MTQAVHQAMSLLSVTLALYALVNLAVTFVKKQNLMSTICRVQGDESCISRTWSLYLMRVFAVLIGSLFVTLFYHWLGLVIFSLNLRA